MVGTLINNKSSHEEDFDRILEGVEFDVEKLMDSPSLIENDGSQDWRGVVKAPIKELVTREGNVWELRGGGALSISFYYDDQ